MGSKHLVLVGDFNLKHLVLVGDFNLITSLEEKKGGWCRMEEECETFRDTIE